MSALRTLIAATVLTVAALPTPLTAQADRIWGEVVTADGTILEGFLRWDRNETGWADLLNGSKTIPEEARELLSDARRRGSQVEDRSIEYAGYRITWDDTREVLAERSDTGIRFGHIDRIFPDGDDAARIVLRSGEEVELEGGSTDLGASLRGLMVEALDGTRTTLDWEEFTEIRLASAPPEARPLSHRMWGTATGRDDHRWSGWIVWDTELALSDDALRGEENGEPRSIPFGEIDRLQRLGFSRARIVTRAGTVHEFEDVEGAVQITDPDLGQVVLPWNELFEIRFHEPEELRGSREEWDGGRPLRGRVELGDGSWVEGVLRWDGDESDDWEILDGRVGDAELSVEFSRIVRIEPTGAEGARVTLRDGRELEMEGSNDVNAQNRGIYVLSEEGEWQYIDWYDVVRVEFDRDAAPAGAAGIDADPEARR